MKTPSIGRIVRYVLPDSHPNKGEIVPAIITRTWGESATCVQLTPFVDVANHSAVSPNDCSSVNYSEGKEPRTWHWPEV